MDFSILASPANFATLMISALLIGMSKTGIQGINTISIPLLALVFGGKESTGLILPMLCFADLIAVAYYRCNAEWRHIFKLLPMAVIGFFVAIYVDTLIPQTEFKRLMALCIFLGLGVMFWSDKKSESQKQKIFSARWYAPLFGLMGGFTTMIGNAAGPVMAVYMLSMRLPKLAFVGTSAWFFLCVNFLKLPLQIFVWDNINAATISANIATVPFILIGAWLGIKFVKKIPESAFRTFIVWMTIISTALLLF